MKNKGFGNVYAGQCRVDIQEYCEKHKIEYDKFHFVSIHNWQDVYNKVIENFVDKTRNYKPELHWLNTKCNFKKDKIIQYSFDSRNQFNWVLRFPTLVENPDNTAYLLIEDDSTKYWIAEGDLKTISEIIYEELSNGDYYIVDKKYRWMITYNHEEIVLFIGDRLNINEIQKLKTLYIRKYEPSDCKQLAKLFYDTVHSVNVNDYTEEQLNSWADGNIDLEKWNQSFLEHYSVVAIIDNMIVGFGDMDRSGYLDRLYVHRDFQRQGIATALCNSLENHCKVKKFSTHASITAKPFFEKMGYIIIKEQQVKRKGILITNFIMEKTGG